MYHPPEVIIKLSALEIQQALAIDRDGDSSQALQFIKEKIVEKCFEAPCKLSLQAMKERLSRYRLLER